jgi:excisionase family DNA binding protein
MASSTNPDELLTVAEVAKELKYKEQTIRTWIKQGRLRATQATNREYRVRRSDMEARVGGQDPQPATATDVGSFESSLVGQFTHDDA